MWRFINGIRGGLRTRTPAPSSQTTPRPDENDGTGVSGAAVRRDDCDTVASDHSGISRPYQGSLQFEDSKEITLRILGTPSEADVLLREFFGPGWKNHRNSEGTSKGCENFRNSFFSGIGLIAIFVGRAAFSWWVTQHRPSRTPYDCFWPKFESSRQEMRDTGTKGCHSLSNRCLQGKFWTSRLRVLPDAFGSMTVLAAGGDIESKITVPCGPEEGRRLDPVQSVTKLRPLEKFVTFEDDDNTEDSASTPSTTSLISDDVLEQFAKDAKRCDGTTYCILGIQSVRVGDYKEAFERFRRGANEGSQNAQFNLGLCYMRGQGIKKDIDKGKQAFERAAYKGHVKAQYNLSLLLMQSENVVDKIRAVRLLESAANGGLLSAQAFLGTFLMRPGKFQDVKKAIKMFKIAAEQGDASSKYHLGICYERGLGGLAQDLLMAFDLYSAAASCEHLDAKYQMAVMIEAGFPGVEGNPKLAHELLTSASEAGHGPSEQLLRKRKAAARKDSASETLRASGGKLDVVQSTALDATEDARAETGRGTNEQITSLTRKLKLASNGNLMSGIGETAPVTSILTRRIARALNNASSHSSAALLVPEYRLPTSLDLQSEFSDTLSGLLRLPRPATTPDLLCLSPAVKSRPSLFSLEV